MAKRSLLNVEFRAVIDHRPVRRAVEKQKRRVLFATGGAVRKIMKRGMRPARLGRRAQVQIPRAPKAGETGGSIPPKPPRYRSKGIRDFIFFAVDLDKEIVSVGPTLQYLKSGISIPQLLNQGGTQTVTLPNASAELPPPVVRATYEPRPFATADSPAFVAGLEFIRRKIRDEELA